MILIKIRQLNMGSEPDLKDFVKLGCVTGRSRSGRPTVINQEKVDEVK